MYLEHFVSSYLPTFWNKMCSINIKESVVNDIVRACLPTYLVDKYLIVMEGSCVWIVSICYYKLYLKVANITYSCLLKKLGVDIVYKEKLSII